MDATTSSTPVLPDEVNKPPEGVVLPPKDIRSESPGTTCEIALLIIAQQSSRKLLDMSHEMDLSSKVSLYIGFANYWLIFKDRIRDHEKHNPKFSFLSPNDAYAAFYAWRLNEVREGRGTAVSAGRAGESSAPAEPEQKGPAPPPEFHFSARMPNLSAQDLEIVKLTALHVSKKGKSWMTALSQREARNPQFDFLRPQHSLYQFFTRLVDQYTELLQTGPDGQKAEKKRIAEITANIQNKFHILDRAKQRAEWVKYQVSQKAAKEEEEQAEQLSYAQIDWHDFVVVETVLFTEADDQADLPPPTSLNDLQSASLEQKAMMSLAPSNMRIEETMPGADDTSYYNPYTQQAQTTPYIPSPQPQYQPSYSPQPPYNQTASPMPPPAIPTQLPSSNFPPQYQAQQVDDETAAINARLADRDAATAARAAATAGPGVGGQPMRIRSNYIPRAQAAAMRKTAATAICPNCQQKIPVDEMDEHMRIELLDPRWKEQRLKADDRAARTNLSTADVANNLKRLASQRSDVFDAASLASGASAPNSAGDVSEEEARRKRRAAEVGGYDGVMDSKEKVAMGKEMNIEEQLRQIHQKYGQ